MPPSADDRHRLGTSEKIPSKFWGPGSIRDPELGERLVLPHDAPSHFDEMVWCHKGCQTNSSGAYP